MEGKGKGGRGGEVWFQMIDFMSGSSMQLIS